MLQSKRLAILLASIFLVTLGGKSPAIAQQKGIFTVSNIAVDVTADNAVAARERAHLQGQREGLSRLLRRLVPAERHAELPDLGGLSLDRYVQNFQIADERLSNTRYLAKMTVAFAPESIRDLLQAARLPFSEEVSAPIVVVPLYDDPNSPTIWPDNNPWWIAWAEELDSESGLRLVMPLGDLEDVGSVSIDQARAGDAIALRRLANRYGAKDALVMSATPLNEAAAGEPLAIRLAARRTGGTDAAGAPFTFQGAPGEPLDNVLRSAVVQLQRSLDEQWKNDHLLRLDTGGLVLVDVPIASLQDWVKINGDLQNLTEVSEIEIASFAQKLVQIQIYYVGDEERFEQALDRIGLALSREGEQWLLQPKGAIPTFDQPPGETSTPS